MARFAIAAGSELAAEAGAEALRAGGTAVDGAIAAAFAACVAEPVLASLFGGGFLMVRDATGRVRLLDFFVQTPARRRAEGAPDIREVSADFGTATQSFHMGAATIAAPGVAAGLAEAHARLGRTPLRDLAEPAVRAAAEGRALEAFQARVLEIIAPIYLAEPATRAIYCGDAAAERTPAAGWLYRNRDLADFLDCFAREGARFAQEGEPAAALAALCEEGGHLTRADLAAYRPEWREPVWTERGGARVALNPPPAAGGALIGFALALAERGADAPAIARALAATASARREAGVDDDPAAGALRLAEPALLARYRREVARRAAAHRGTTHISVVDAEGGAAALSLSNGEGCGLVAPGCGCAPNNMLGEADLVPEPERWRPNERLSSMMAPTAVEWPDGRFALLGSGGSNRIRSAVAQVVAHLVDREDPPDIATARPRLHVEGAEAQSLDFEDRFSDAERAALIAAWPEARPWPEDSMFFGGVHIAMRERRGGALAAGDPRRAGVARFG